MKLTDPKRKQALDPLLKKIAHHISMMRHDRKLSQFALSKEAEMSQTYYCELEKCEHNISIGTLAKIAKALKVNIKDLIPDDV